MELGIKGKRALVTGAGRGIGEAITVSLAREGAKMAIVSRTSDNLSNLLQRIGGKGRGHYMIAADLAKKGMPEKVMRKLNKEFGNFDIVVNNLGGNLNITDPFCPISDWRNIWRINLEVAIELNNLVIPYMKKKKWGRIVNISSISAVENQGTIPYCATKAALNAYTRSMGRVLAPDGVIMCAVLPGAIKTKKGYWEIASKTNPSHVKKYLAERMAIKRFGKPEEISEVVTFLCSRYASFCVGSIIPVDGGQGRSFFDNTL